MLNKNQKNSKEQVSPYVFQKDTFFRGSLEFHSPLLILGRFEGDIAGAYKLEISKEARVEATIQVESVVVYGEVVGNIYASKKVELKNGSKVVGNIRTPNLEVEEGVIFEGLCEMKQENVTS